MSVLEPRVMIARISLGTCHMQVCAVKDATDEEILQWCNRENPADTTNGWTTVLRENSDRPPVECSGDSTRLHIVVGCR